MWLLPLSLLLVSTASGYVQQGFLLTAPKVLSAGTKEQLCITFFNLRGPVRVNVFLLPKVNSTAADQLALLSQSIDASDKETSCFDFPIPKKLTQRNAFIRAVVNGGGFGGFSSQKTSKVALKPFELVTLVQTDKTKYKAGQLVQFRVVTLRADLTALEETIEQIFVTTPAGTRLAQFDDVATQSGIAQQSLQLTDEPPLGTWTIHVKRGDKIVRQTFQVEEFVLPRFDVALRTPKYIIRRANTLTVKVCAEYTFGKPVAGAAVSLRVASSVSYYQIARALRHSPPRIRKDARQNITLTEETGDDGCVTLDVLLSKIGLGSRSTFYAYRLSVKANVTEAGTGLTQSADASVAVKDRRRSITRDQYASTFIKPGIAYTGFAIVKDEDGQPVPRERLQVCHTAYYSPKVARIPHSSSVQLSSPQFRRLPIIVPVPHPDPTKSSRVCREYDSNRKGQITYTIPALDPGLRRVYVSIGGLRPRGHLVVTLSPRGGHRSRRPIQYSSAGLSLRVWFSPTNSYISIIPTADPTDLKCDDRLNLALRSKTVTGEAVYLLMARGQIVHQGTVVFRNFRASLSIPLRFELSPRFKVLVYHVNRLGEVVSDSRTFKVANCFQNEVKVSWDKKQAKPGEDVSFTVEGANGALCGVTAVDKSVELLSDANKLTAEKVFAKLRRFIIEQYSYPRLVESPHIYCKRKPQFDAATVSLSNFVEPRSLARLRFDNFVRSQGAPIGRFAEPDELRRIELPPRPIRPLPIEPPPRPIKPSSKVDYYYVVEEDDSIKAFDVAGYVPVTNLALETRRCERRNRTRYIYHGPRHHFGPQQRATAGGGGGRILRRGRAPMPNVMAFASSVPEVAADSDESVAKRASPAAESSPAALEGAVRSFFPATFLFELLGLGSGTGRGVITKKAPDTITSWIGSAFCSHPTDGFGLSESTALTVFKPFFAQIQVPFSVKRGELLRLKVSVFNFLSSDLSVVVELQPSDDYRLEGGASTQSICVSASKPRVVSFPLQFNSLGQVDITVSLRTGGTSCGGANTVQASDALKRSLRVKPEGFPQEETSSSYVCRTSAGQPPIEQRFALERRPTLVKDSERVWVSAVGDLLAPSVAKLERLVRVPSGCGEQNMIGFVPNIYVRRYLEAVSLITDSLRTRTTNNMVTGYQRELRYRGTDGSYAAFQPTKVGSLWLTAYVVRSYVAAAKYITIDSADLDISRKWLLKQQAGDGSFPKVGRLFHREMKGGVEFGGTEALTAFVILTLIESGGQQAAIDKALTFIGQKNTFGTLYTEVLVAHAFVMAGRPEGATRVKALLDKGKRRNSQLYWEGDRTSKHGGSRAVDVEMTSYMVLSLLKLGGPDNLSEAVLAIKWVNTQRNSAGGWVSTQDTVVALSALTEFAIATYSPSVAVQVAVTTSSGGFSQEWSITGRTRLLTRQQKVLPLTLPNAVVFRVTGIGCALVQSVFRYSTNTAFPDPSFKLSAVMTKSSCSSIVLRVCTNFIKPNAESNMAIVEIEMLSGWVTSDASLRELKQGKVIERWEFNNGKAILYFDEFSTKEVCFEVRMLQDIEVEKLKPAVVRVYDFYATEDRFEVEYGPPSCE